MLRSEHRRRQPGNNKLRLRELSFIGKSVMRIAGMTVLIVGFFLSFSIDEWEAVGLIPMGIGLILLTVGERQASVLGLADVEPFESQAEIQTYPPSQNESSATDEVPVSAEVLVLLETLSRSSRAR